MLLLTTISSSYRLAADTAMKRSYPLSLDRKRILSFSKNDSSRQWILAKGVVVTSTHFGLYYAGRAVINQIFLRDSFLLNIQVLKVSNSIEMIIAYPTADMKYCSQCVGINIMWKERYVRLYIKASDSLSKLVG